jgi:regulator of replication initiation timing
MHVAEPIPRTGTSAAADDLVLLRIELDELQATCRRQAHVIDSLSEAVTTFHRRTQALTAENVTLRLENDHLRKRRARGSGQGPEGAKA